MPARTELTDKADELAAAIKRLQPDEILVADIQGFVSLGHLAQSLAYRELDRGDDYRVAAKRLKSEEDPKGRRVGLFLRLKA